jgi:hypothetical protein
MATDMRQWCSDFAAALSPVLRDLGAVSVRRTGTGDTGEVILVETPRLLLRICVNRLTTGDVWVEPAYDRRSAGAAVLRAIRRGQPASALSRGPLVVGQGEQRQTPQDAAAWLRICLLETPATQQEMARRR